MTEGEPLGAITRVPLLEQTANLIREAILDGRLRPGEKLNEVRLAQELGMSRGPVREALRMLTEHGLVRWEANRGSFVTEFTFQDVVEVNTLRGVLEPLAARAALSDPDPELLPTLEAALEEMYEAARRGQADRLVGAHVLFHGSFYIHARHRLLRVLWERLQIPLRLYVSIHRPRFGTPEEIAAGHESTLRATREGNVAALQREMRAHLAANLESVIASLSGPEAEEANRLLRRVGPDPLG